MQSLKQKKENSSKNIDEEKKIHKMNAFDLISHLMMGAINPLVNNNSKIKRETNFLADGKLKQVIEYINHQLEDLKYSPQILNNTIKCFKTINNTLISFLIEIIEITGDICLVEVRRSKGDILNFNKLYRAFENGCKIAFIEKN